MIKNSQINNNVYNIVKSGTKEIPAFIKGLERQISDMKNSEFKAVFKEISGKLSLSKNFKSQDTFDGLATVAQKVDIVENPDIKKELLSTLTDLATKDKKQFKKEYSSQITYVEDLADAVNVLNDKYQRTDSTPANYYRLLNKHNSWYLDLMEGRKGSPSDYRSGFASQSGHIPYEVYSEEYENSKHLNLPEVFKNDLKLDSIRKFSDKYIMSKPDIVETLFNTEYLKTVPPDLRQAFKDIKKDFGTFTMFSNVNTTLEDANYVKEELKLWKKAGGIEARLPYLIDVDALNHHLQKSNACGASLPPGKIVVLDLLGQDTLKRGFTLRHEMTHLNDNCPRTSVGKFVNKLKWDVLKKLHKDKWEKALDRAGVINQSLRKYALSSPAELKSVTSEVRDYSSLSNEFLKDLISRFKMPYWIFEMGQNPVREKRLVKDFMNN